MSTSRSPADGGARCEAHDRFTVNEPPAELIAPPSRDSFRSCQSRKVGASFRIRQKEHHSTCDQEAGQRPQATTAESWANESDSYGQQKLRMSSCNWTGKPSQTEWWATGSTQKNFVKGILQGQRSCRRCRKCVALQRLQGFHRTGICGRRCILDVAKWGSPVNASCRSGMNERLWNGGHRAYDV